MQTGGSRPDYRTNLARSSEQIKKRHLSGAKSLSKLLQPCQRNLGSQKERTGHPQSIRQAKTSTCFTFVLRITSGYEVHLRFPCRCFALGFALSTRICLVPPIHLKNFAI